MQNQVERQQNLLRELQQTFGDQLQNLKTGDMVSADIDAQNLLAVGKVLHYDEPFNFEQLTDLCGVDYLEYGTTEWRTQETTESGYSRGVEPKSEQVLGWNKPRYAVVYHLLSLSHNQRMRLRVFLEPEPVVPSVIDIWNAANWYEREAYDLFGIVFDGHPDLRRLLTDYGFVGHPFRKDFPLIGEVELRYDATQQRCVYEPVSIQPRVLVPKVVREDHRYIVENPSGEIHG
jgi:NADH-quinone oxidoreductase subunit C